MRNIFIVNATQTVVSDNHPEGVFGIISGYPKTFDSRNYPAADGNPNGDADKALRAAQGEYHTEVGTLYNGSGNRVMWTVTLESADGRQWLRESWGAVPDMTPAPEPAPEAEAEAEVGE
jgi:hypothetical protein